MRNWLACYTAIAIWTFGWLSGRFGTLPSVFPFAILCVPSLLTWRMITTTRPTKRREYLYLGVVTLLAVCGTGIVVYGWQEAGMEDVVLFEREVARFKNYVSSMPEYEHVQVSYTRQKGGLLYLRGHVSTKEDHDKLLEINKRMIRHNGMSCYNDVDYPGKSPEPKVPPSVGLRYENRP